MIVSNNNAAANAQNSSKLEASKAHEKPRAIVAEANATPAKITSIPKDDLTLKSQNPKEMLGAQVKTINKEIGTLQSAAKAIKEVKSLVSDYKSTNENAKHTTNIEAQSKLEKDAADIKVQIAKKLEDTSFGGQKVFSTSLLDFDPKKIDIKDIDSEDFMKSLDGQEANIKTSLSKLSKQLDKLTTTDLLPDIKLNHKNLAMAHKEPSETRVKELLG
ncbi:hypothetical protein BKH43_05815 [Helicobacter sp. 13S00401-1]|uniref:hypothetical protein n=1 Tax=Helicobacter sp. 13S00401-1 TaxID=1905758 RepID=UPI000BA79501|nr:hypothetical protein [Helicobacter sp. 13S00401-1]PAF50125.1 hypothetical protein BKH43_05815 [Helicobacter sp. 13S00401-1]